jgi:hypothetical protein
LKYWQEVEKRRGQVEGTGSFNINHDVHIYLSPQNLKQVLSSYLTIRVSQLKILQIHGINKRSHMRYFARKKGKAGRVTFFSVKLFFIACTFFSNIACTSSLAFRDATLEASGKTSPPERNLGR